MDCGKFQISILIEVPFPKNKFISHFVEYEVSLLMQAGARHKLHWEKLRDRAREQIVRAKTGRAPYEHCQFRELKFLDSKVCYRRAKEVEETDIPRTFPSIDAAIVARSAPWISSLTIVIQ